MSFLATIITVILSVLEWKHTRNNKKLSPALFFLVLWAFILFLSCFQLYGLNRPSVQSILLLLCMIIFFYIGTLIARKFPIKNKIIKEYKYIKTPNKLFYIICILALVINIYDIVLVIIQFANGTPAWQIRNWILEPFGSSNPMQANRTIVEQLLRTVIISPIYLIIPPLLADIISHWKKTEKNIVNVILYVLLIVTSTIAQCGGRLLFIYLVICILLAIFTDRKKFIKQLKARTKNIYITATVIVFCILIATIYTIIRVGVNSIFKQFYLYFALPPTLLSEWLPQISQAPHTFGLLTFFGLHSYIFRALNMLGLSFLVPPVFSQAFDHILAAEKNIQVGAGAYNAFVTPIYYFIIDGGIIFVILASLFFGWIISQYYERTKNNTRLHSNVFYSIIIYGLFVSFMRVQTCIPNYLITLVLGILIFLPIKVKHPIKHEKKHIN